MIVFVFIFTPCDYRVLDYLQPVVETARDKPRASLALGAHGLQDAAMSKMYKQALSHFFLTFMPSDYLLFTIMPSDYLLFYYHA